MQNAEMFFFHRNIEESGANAETLWLNWFIEDQKNALQSVVVLFQCYIINCVNILRIFLINNIYQQLINNI